MDPDTDPDSAFQVNPNPDTDPVPVPDSCFDDQKLKKDSRIFLHSFLIKYAIYLRYRIPRLP